MIYSFSISTRKGDEYRIMLFDVDLSLLGEKVKESPIVIKGEGYTQYMHLIARDKHKSIVEQVKEDIKEGWGK